MYELIQGGVQIELEDIDALMKEADSFLEELKRSSVSHPFDSTLTSASQRDSNAVVESETAPNKTDGKYV